MSLAKVLIPLFLFTLIPCSANAGVYYKAIIQSNMDSDQRIEETYISGTKMKTLIDGEHGWLVDLAEGKMWDYDLKRGTYYVISFPEINRELDAFKKGVNQMDDLPDNEIAELLEGETVRQNPKTPEVNGEWKTTKKKKEINGQNCFLIQVDLSKNHYQHLWVTDDLPFVEEVRYFWSAFYRNVFGKLNAFPELKQQYQILSELPGFTMEKVTRIEAFQDQYYEEIEKVQVIEEKQFKESVFLLPPSLSEIKE